MFLTASFGSYPRPQSLREYLLKAHGKQKKANQNPTEEDSEEYIKALREVVGDEVGLDVITDGQLSWDDYLASVMASWQGVKMTGLIRFFDNNNYYRRPVIESAINAGKPVIAPELELLKEANPGAKIKAVIPGPYTLYSLSDDKFYNNAAEGISAISKALLSELDTIEADFIQIDEPALSYNPPSDDDFIHIKEEIEKLSWATRGKSIVATYFGKLDSSLAGRLADIKCDYVGLDCVSMKNDLNIAKDAGIKNAQLGLVDARNIKAEDPAKVASVANDFGDDVIISTNCGLEYLPREYALRKLDILKATSNI